MAQQKDKSALALTSQLAQIRSTLKRELGDAYDEKIEPVRVALREVAQEKQLAEVLQQAINDMLAKEADNIEMMTLISAGLDVLEESKETRH
jgi:hypothetical protein